MPDPMTLYPDYTRSHRVNFRSSHNDTQSGKPEQIGQDDAMQKRLHIH
jgi:hypothetical protein